MSYENIKLFFAKNADGNIVTIDEINDDNKNNTYSCAMCGSILIPKATKSIKVSSHFSHVDASKCSNETMIHWWFKNKFLENGDSFVVTSDKERKYICKEVLVEQNYKLDDGKIYNPDVTVLTECGETIYFEMDYINKKKVEDYIDIWLELRNIVVEVDVKKLMNQDENPMFRALFYEGKCFNIKKNDIYYNTIGKYKQEKLSGKVSKDIKERIQKLDWLWRDFYRYKKLELNIDYMVELIDSVDIKDRQIVQDILKRSFCNELYKDYKKIKAQYDLAKFDDLKDHYAVYSREVESLNQKYQKFDSNYELKFSRNTETKSVSYFNGTRKYPYKYRQEFSHHTYHISVYYKRKKNHSD